MGITMKYATLACVIAGFIAELQAAPKDNTWYAGAKVGWSQYQGTAVDSTYSQYPVSASADQVGAGAFVGYQINPYLGLEAGYDWLGRMSYSGNPNNGAFKSQGIQLAVKLDYPVRKTVDVYTRLGGLIWKSNSNFNFINNNENKSSNGISPLVAVGLEYLLTDNIATRLEYQWAHNVGKGDLAVKPDNSLLSLALLYRFDQDNPVVPAAVATQVPAPAMPLEPKRFTLDAAVLFDFNKAALKSSGEQELNKLYGELLTLDPQATSLIVLGFTDRLGKVEYNQKLSEKRAQTVVDYLVMKGVPANKISSRGMGASHSITKDTCANMKQHALVQCLAPDRRVEIEVHGLQTPSTQPK